MRPVLTASVLALAIAATVSTPSLAQPQPKGRQVSTSSASAGTVSWRTPDTSLPGFSLSNTMIDRAGAASGVRPSGASSIIRIDAPSSPSSYSFTVSLPRAASASLAADGSVVISESGGPVGSFLPLWAKDANGRSLPTHYTLTGNPAAGYVLTQDVATKGAIFPVLADPHYTWGWISGTVYFNRVETQKAAASVGFLATIAAFAPPPFDALFVVMGVYYSIKAGWAVADNKFLEIKSDGEAYEYSGGHCR